MPDISHRDRNIFGESAGAVDADALRVLAEVPASGQAIAASAAHDVTLGADHFTREEILYIGADLSDLADKLVPDDHRRGDGALGPIVPFVNVQVGAANPGAVHMNEDVVDSGLRLGNLFEPEAR